jgi:hypothetical protein
LLLQLLQDFELFFSSGHMGSYFPGQKRLLRDLILSLFHFFYKDSPHLHLICKCKFV